MVSKLKFSGPGVICVHVCGGGPVHVNDPGLGRNLA